MSSRRFVPAGGNDTDNGTDNDNDAWSNAQKAIDEHIKTQRPEPGKQAGGKSLYEVLQENKGKRIAPLNMSWDL